MDRLKDSDAESKRQKAKKIENTIMAIVVIYWSMGRTHFRTYFLMYTCLKSLLVTERNVQLSLL